MSSREWLNAVAELASSTIKGRNEAIARLRELVSSNRSLAQIQADPRHKWSDTLQPLMGLVVTERNANVSSKATAATAKRLDDATNLLRLIVEKNHHNFNKKAVKSVLKHLIQTIVVHGKLQSFALTYLKALRALLSHAPHVEHLDEQQWTDIVQLGFAAVLGDHDLRIGSDFTDSQAMAVDGDEPVGTALRATAEDEDELDSFARAPRSRPKKRTSASPTEIELMGCIEAVFKSTSSRFIEYSSVILAKFVRFFQLYSAETTAHLPAVTALNRALSQLDLNDQRAMRDFSPKIWPHLIELWATKNSSLKEQVVISLRYMFPFIAPSGRTDPAVQSCLKPVYEAALTEPTIRWREPYELEIDNLALGLDKSPSSSGTQPYHRETFRIGPGFGEKQAMGWATVELGADALARVYAASEEVRPASEPEPNPTPTPSGATQGRNKRRKIEDPLGDLIESLISGQYTSLATAFRAQLVTFFVDQHWQLLHFDLCNYLLKTITSLASHPDLQLQNWAFILAATVATKPWPAQTADLRQPTGVDWESIWSLALRKLSQAEVCRTAAHAANVLLACDKVGPALISASLEGLASELDVQGPHFPSDAVCTFLESAINLAEEDVKLFRVGLADKALSWLVTGWKPLQGTLRSFSIGQARPRADPLALGPLVRLIGRLCGLGRVPPLPSEVLVPDCAVANQAVELTETGPMRDFISAKVPTYSPPAAQARPQDSTTVLAAAPKPTQEETQRKVQARVSGWASKMLEKLASEADEVGHSYWNSMSAESIRRHLDLASLGLIVEGLFQLNGHRTNSITLKAATNIITLLCPTLVAKKWSALDRATILHGLSPIFVEVPGSAAVAYPVLLDPGSGSGLPTNLVRPGQPELARTNLSSPRFELLRLIWAQPVTGVALSQVTNALRGLLELAANLSPAPTQAGFTQPGTFSTQRGDNGADPGDDEDDDFGVINDGRRGGLAVSSTATSERASAASLNLCVRALTSSAMAESGLAKPVKIPDLVTAMTESDGVESLALLEQLCNAVRSGLCELRASEAVEVLQHLGEDIIGGYEFARSEKAGLLGLQLLECTASSWIVHKEDDSAAEWEANTRHFLAWYTQRLTERKLFAWRVRLKLIALLDHYLSIDTKQLLWNPDGKIPGLDALPSAMIPFLLADDDFRVRFRAATSSAGLFTFVYDNNLNDENLFDDIKREAGETDSNNVELTLTTILCHANILINSAARRRGLYQALLRIGAEDSRFTELIGACLLGAVQRFGMKDLRQLYRVYKRFVAASRKEHMSVVDITALSPPRLCGFGSVREQRAEDLDVVGAQIIMSEFPSEQFDAICKTLKLTPQQGLLAVFSETAALMIVGNLATGSPPDGLEHKLAQLAQAAGTDDAHQAERLIRSRSDEIGAIVLSVLHEEVWEAAGPQATLDKLDKKAAKVMFDLLGLKTDLVVVQSLSPAFSLSTVVQALDWLNKTYGLLKEPAAVYSILHKLLGQVHEAPFVDLQRQLLISLSLHLALSHRVVRSSTQLLAAVLGGLTPLLGLVDLAPLVYPIIKWALIQWLGVADGLADSGEQLCELLLQASWVCHSLQTGVGLDSSPAVNAARAVWRKLEDFIRQALASLQKRAGQPSAVEAGLLTPAPAQQPNEASLSALKAALGSSFSGVGKFKLVGPLAGRADLSSDPAKGEVAWRLLETMSETEQPSGPDCLALGSVLYQTGGEVDPPSLGEMTALAETRGLAQTAIESDDGIKMSILSRLLDSVQSHDQQLVAVVFDCIRNIFSLPTGSAFYNHTLLSKPAAATAALLQSPVLARPDRVRQAAKRSLDELDSDSWLEAGAEFEPWVRRLASLLAEVRGRAVPFYAQLVPLVGQSEALASALLPELVHAVLMAGALSGEDDERNSLSAYFELLLERKSTATRSAKAIVDVALYLRRHEQPRMTANEPSPISCDQWLGVRWIVLAEAAARTGAYIASLLFLELGHEYESLFRDEADSSVERQGQDLLYQIYANVDEPDGFYGRQSKDVRQAVIKRYHHEGRWTEAFGLHGAEFESHPTSAFGRASRSRAGPAAGVVQSLASFGFNRLATSVLGPAGGAGSSKTGSGVDDGLSYELAWRTDTWDLPVEAGVAGESSVSLYSALRSVRTAADRDGLMKVVEGAVQREASKLAKVSVEWPRPGKQAISTLLALNEVAKFPLLKLDDEHLNPGLVLALGQLPDGCHFEHAERILSTRVSLLRAIRAQEQAHQVGDLLTSLAQEAADAEKACLLKLSSVARVTTGQLQTALNAVTFAHQLVPDGAVDLEVDHELANVLWAQHEHSTAVSLLRDIHRQEITPKPMTLVQLGEWTAEARLKSSREISAEYFVPAIEALATAASSPDERANVHAAFAAFADGQYEDVHRAAEDKRKRYVAFRERKQREFEDIDSQLKQASSRSETASVLDRQKRKGVADLEEDEGLLREAEATAKAMLWNALENFANAIKHTSGAHDDKVFRFCALWLDHAADEAVHKKLSHFLPAIPSAKFVFLAYQLSARLAKPAKPTNFDRNVQKLVQRLAEDHPFHSLFAVHALRAGGEAAVKSKSGRRTSTVPGVEQSTQQLRSTSARAAAADDVFARVKMNPKLVERVEAIELASAAYTEWAAHNIKADARFADNIKADKGGQLKRVGSKGHVVPASMLIRSKVIDLPIPVSTVDLPVDPTTQYRSGTFPTVARYDHYFTTAGGVNVPKIMTCVDSQGGRHKQLLKGGDDIRQDAVMEQAFVLINSVLARDEHSRRRHLRIRTYKVVPLQNRNGLIEFVADTKPIGDVLGALYKRYRPNELQPSRARQLHQAVQNAPPEERLEEYKRLVEEMPPLMRRFFLDQHKLPSLWFDMRLNYARSLATTSIIGHVVGLGDRHVSNILIDEVKGELVPIDLGIAFEQGRRLPIPELVPFRLTPNFVDGLGMHGVEGVFRHCAQHTLRVLSEQSRVLMTVLSVFKHDPLQAWAVSAEVAARIQGDAATSKGGAGEALKELPDDADRALLIVRGKLQGGLSVEYRVNQLIMEATDQNNLASIFCGESLFRLNRTGPSSGVADQFVLFGLQAGSRVCSFGSFRRVSFVVLHHSPYPHLSHIIIRISARFLVIPSRPRLWMRAATLRKLLARSLSVSGQVSALVGECAAPISHCSYALAFSSSSTALSAASIAFSNHSTNSSSSSSPTLTRTRPFSTPHPLAQSVSV